MLIAKDNLLTEAKIMKKQMKSSAHSTPLLRSAQPFLAPGGHVLDLACGKGRNGLLLQQQGFELSFLDRDQSSLDQIEISANNQIICGDLESATPYQLPTATYDAILVFRYLHRPLFVQIIAALKPGGFIVYETFTHHQAKIGRPKNPNFLLNTNELLQSFDDFSVQHFFEGFCEQQKAYISQLIAQKPQ
jgi:SAM-dependent methyltransferase